MVPQSTTRGFTLIELMVVIAVISIIATLAATSFPTFIGKARQAEAKQNIRIIYALEISYFNEHQIFAFLPGNGLSASGTIMGKNIAGMHPAGSSACNIPNVLGFYLSDCSKVRYGYQALASNVPGSFGFDAFANSGNDQSNYVFSGCATEDVWQINHNAVIKNIKIGGKTALEACR